MPTSASTGSDQVSTAGKNPDQVKAIKADLKEKAKENKDEHGETTVVNAEVISEAGKDRNTPDGAPVVEREEDVVGGVRVDLPPSAPADPAKRGIGSQSGIQEVTRPDGSRVLLNAGDDDFDEHAKAIREGKRNH